MAISVTALTSGSSTTNASPVATASISPAADSLLLVIVQTTGTAQAPSVSGLGLSWTQRAITGLPTAGTTTRKLVAITAQCGAAPGSGTLSIANGGSSPTGQAWTVLQITGHDTTTPVPQSATNAGTSISTISATLGSAEVSTNSRCVFGCAQNNPTANTITPRTNWTELSEVHYGTPASGLETQWRSDAFEATGSATFDSTYDGGALILEIAAAGAAAPLRARPEQVVGQPAAQRASRW